MKRDLLVERSVVVVARRGAQDGLCTFNTFGTTVQRAQKSLFPRTICKARDSKGISQRVELLCGIDPKCSGAFFRANRATGFWALFSCHTSFDHLPFKNPNESSRRRSEGLDRGLVRSLFRDVRVESLRSTHLLACWEEHDFESALRFERT